jgi:hypothetical protein
VIAITEHENLQALAVESRRGTYRFDLSRE